MSANSNRIRKPGEDFELTDEELLAAPPRMLSATQRRKRRQLKNNRAKQKTRSRRREHRESGEAKVKYCQATKTNGEKCSGYALIGAQHCFVHVTEEEREHLNLVKPSRGNGESSLPPANAVQLMRETVETTVEKILDPYFRANGLKLLGFNEDGKAVVQDLGEDSGLMLHGESKDGDIVMTNFPDIAGRVNINEKLLDRVYGKPKQTQVLEGGVRPVQIQPVRTVERAHQVSSLLAQVGAVGGAQNPAALPASSGPSGSSESGGVVIEGELVRLRPDQNGSDKG